MLDLKKPYKRIFAFGCSFTNYSYPTWANLIAMSYPNAKFFNFGRSGGGNLFISARITEANNKFKFNKNDLIIVMWSTFCREDRFIKNQWVVPGNIFSQHVYDKKFVRSFADAKGYLIKDLSLINLSSVYLNNLESDVLSLTSVPFTFQQEEDVSQITLVYSDLIKSFPKSLYELAVNSEWPQEIEFYFEWNLKNKTYDYHPHTLHYANYLIKLGIDLPKSVVDYAHTSLEKIKKTEYFIDLDKVFPETKKQNTNGKHLIWG
jgi:hypothetical protein